MSSQSEYEEYAPSAALKQYVDCYWSSASQPGHEAHRILPDACIDIIFSSDLAEYRGGVVVGTMTQAQAFHPSVPVSMVAIRFHPGGAWPFLGVPAKDFTDQRAPLSDVLVNPTLPERIETAGSVRDKLFELERDLLRRLPRVATPDSRVAAAIQSLRLGADVDEAANGVSLSRQHLTRLFQQHIGVGPKRFARISRLQKLLAQFSGQEVLNWSSMACDLGYFDQSHLISECQELAGLSPTELRASRLAP